MSLSLNMSAAERSKNDYQIDSYNKMIAKGRKASQSLGKDDFMKILITQLQHQDPTKPMEDKEFIAQMAQFSSLEQMSNLSGEFSKMASVSRSSQAYGLLGKNVEIFDNGMSVSGVVQAVKGGDFPQLVVNGESFDYSKVTQVKKLEGESTL